MNMIEKEFTPNSIWLQTPPLKQFLGPVASASLWFLMQILGLQLRPAESETPEKGSTNMRFHTRAFALTEV